MAAHKLAKPHIMSFFSYLLTGDVWTVMVHIQGVVPTGELWSGWNTQCTDEISNTECGSRGRLGGRRAHGARRTDGTLRDFHSAHNLWFEQINWRPNVGKFVAHEPRPGSRISAMHGIMLDTSLDLAKVPPYRRPWCNDGKLNFVGREYNNTYSWTTRWNGELKIIE